MTSTTIQAVNDKRNVSPNAKTGGGFVAYVSVLREAFIEAMQKTSEARRKYPFADV